MMIVLYILAGIGVLTLWTGAALVGLTWRRR